MYLEYFKQFLNFWNLTFEYLEFWNFFEFLEFREQSCVLHFETCYFMNLNQGGKISTYTFIRNPVIIRNSRVSLHIAT